MEGEVAVNNMAMPIQKELTLKSTKAEMMQAFEEMKEKYKRLEKEKLAPEQEKAVKKEEEKVIEKTSAYSPESLETEIIGLRKKVFSYFDGTINQLSSEAETLHNLRQAVQIESKKLEELYNIQLAAGALNGLIADFEIKERELKDKAAADEADLQKDMAAKKREWEREKEEYKYGLNRERRIEEEEYEMKQAQKRIDWEEKVKQKEAELSEREKAIAAQEAENADMKSRIESFPEKMEKAIEEAKTALERGLKREFDHERQLAEQKETAAVNVLEVKNNNLQETINNQNQEIKSLKDNLNKANQQAQNLATAIVEGASKTNQLRLEALAAKEEKRFEENKK